MPGEIFSESRFLGEISITSDMQMHHPYGRKRRKTKEPLGSERGEWKSWLKAQHSENYESERGECKSWLKAQHSETKIMASDPITSWQIDGETVEIMIDFILGGSKITADGICSHEIFNAYSLEGKL